MNVLLVGASQMAIDYANVLKELNVEFTVVGRSVVNCETFENATAKKALSGGLQKFTEQNSCAFTHAINAVGVEQLNETTKLLLNYGIKNILVEKPGGMNENELQETMVLVKEKQAEVFIAYNRRFYSSVKKAQEIIEEDGGVLSFNFEFTEWSHIFRNLDISQRKKDAMLLCNSTHVIDLAFFLGGVPQEMHEFHRGENDWNNGYSIFAGTGISKEGALFTYHANWIAPGRWGVELLTSNHRLILRPLEQLFVQKKGSIAIEEVKLENHADIEFKPGLLKQVEAFLGISKNKRKNLIPIEQQLEMLIYYQKISGCSFY